MANDAQKVYGVVSQIPKGKVLTYKRVAELAGVKSPRLVGNILHQNSDQEHISCHRVVNSQCHVAKNYAFGDADEQVKKIKKENILVKIILCHLKNTYGVFKCLKFKRLSDILIAICK